MSKQQMSHLPIKFRQRLRKRQYVESFPYLNHDQILQQMHCY